MAQGSHDVIACIERSNQLDRRHFHLVIELFERCLDGGLGFCLRDEEHERIGRGVLDADVTEVDVVFAAGAHDELRVDRFLAGRDQPVGKAVLLKYFGANRAWTASARDLSDRPGALSMMRSERPRDASSSAAIRPVGSGSHDEHVGILNVPA